MPCPISRQNFQRFVQNLINPETLTPKHKIRLKIARIALAIFTVGIFEAYLCSKRIDAKKELPAPTDKDLSGLIPNGNQPEGAQTPEAKPETPETKSETPETKSETPETKSETPETKSETPETKSETPETKSETPETKSETPEAKPETPETKSETPETKSETPETKSETQTPEAKKIADPLTCNSFVAESFFFKKHSEFNSDEFIKTVLEPLEKATPETAWNMLNELKTHPIYSRLANTTDTAYKRRTNVNAYLDTSIDAKLSGNKIEMPFAQPFYAYQAPDPTQVPDPKKDNHFNEYFSDLKRLGISQVIVLGKDVVNFNTSHDSYYPLDGNPFNYSPFNMTVESSTPYDLKYSPESKSKDKDKSFKHIVKYNNTKDELTISTYADWPDKKTTDSQALLDFVKKIAKDADGKSIGVHCSAAIGRTGSFLAVYYAYLLHKNGHPCHLNAAQIIACLRLFRENLVENEVQVKFIYDTIALLNQEAQ